MVYVCKETHNMVDRTFVSLLFILLFTFVSVVNAKKVRIDNYGNSVYVKVGGSLPLQLEPMSEDTIYVDRDNYELITVTENTERIVDSNGTKKKGHLVQFIKYIGDTYSPRTVLAFFFTNDSYYFMMKREIMPV